MDDQAAERRLWLRRAPGDSLRVAALAGIYPRVGLTGLLAARGTRARRATVPAPAALSGYRWNRRDRRDREWWPQGVDVQAAGEAVPGAASGLVVAVSWYAKPRGGREVATRLSFVDLSNPRRPRYHHVLLVDPDADGGFSPVAVHAGGIAWHGDRVHVADTFGGLRVFLVDDILRITRPRGLGAWIRLALERRRGILHRRDPALGFDHVLPQSGGYGADTPDGLRRMRYSFVSLEHDAEAPHLVAGEYRNADDQGRLVRMPIDPATGDVRFADTDAPLALDDVHEPHVERMQGVCVVDGTWFITTSQGTRRNGDLWVGVPGELTRHRGVLPRGPEDLAREPGTRRLWSVTEQPGARWVYALDADAWM